MRHFFPSRCHGIAAASAVILTRLDIEQMNRRFAARKSVGRRRRLLASDAGQIRILDDAATASIRAMCRVFLSRIACDDLRRYVGLSVKMFTEETRSRARFTSGLSTESKKCLNTAAWSRSSKPCSARPVIVPPWPLGPRKTRSCELH